MSSTGNSIAVPDLRIKVAKNVIVSLTAMTLLFLISYQNLDVLFSENKQLRRNTKQAYELLYHNIPAGDDGEMSDEPKRIENEYPAGKSVICALVTNRTKDVDELTTALRSTAFLKGDQNEKVKAPVLVFNEGNLSEEQEKSIIASTKRPVAFPRVDFSKFPDGYDPLTLNNANSKFRVKGRDEWGYYQMIRFWVTGIWKHPALDHYEVVMRIDSDSCFKENNDYLPLMKNSNLVYHSQYVGVEDGKEFTIGLYDFAVNYMSTNNRQPMNPMLWQFVKSTWDSQNTLPVFGTNFEVSSKTWMTRPDVAMWHEALTEQEPFGIFRHRWGDAVTRFLTAAMFSTNEEVMTARATGYGHKERCAKEDVEKALSKIESTA